MSGISITFWMSSEVNLKLESELVRTMLAQLTNRQPNLLTTEVARDCHCQQMQHYLPPGPSQPAHTAERIMHLMPSSVDVVHLCITTEHGDDVQLSAFVIPLICDPLQSQSIVHASVTHAHLRGIKLADYSTGEDDIMVDILVGSDQYWQLVSEKVVRGKDGKNVTSIAARKEILKRAGYCFVCLKRNHISKKCSSRMKCLKCGRQNHISICTSDTNNEVKSLHTPNVEGSASLPQSQTSCSPPRESSGRPTVLYVNASTPILLQTAKAAIYRPGQPNEKFLARLILDSGSQRSYVTTTVKDKLRLPSERKQTISVKTFGSTEENTQSVDVVHLCITTEHGDDVQLSAFVIPLICDPLQSQSIVHASVTHAHLRGIKLADYSTGEDDIMVDILVGSDQYWQLVSEKVVRGEDGPTAIQTKLNWMGSLRTNKWSSAK